jgi:hypothetical protein
MHQFSRSGRESQMFTHLLAGTIPCPPDKGVLGGAVRTGILDADKAAEEIDREDRIFLGGVIQVLGPQTADGAGGAL